MAFPSGAISLGDVLGPSGYNTAAKDMATLNGRIYYNADGTQGTINCSAGNPFSLGTLRGKYANVSTGTLPARDAYGENITRVNFGIFGGVQEMGGVSGRAGFNAATYRYVGGRVISISIDVYYTSNRHGASSGSLVGNSNLEIFVDGIRSVYRSQSGNISGTYAIPCPITSSLRIHLWSDVSDYGTSGARVDGSWTFTVNLNGQLV
jgi:hypothetical protein